MYYDRDEERNGEDEEIELPDRQKMKDLGKDGYKYLGVLETSEINHRDIKDTMTKEYTRRVKLLLKSMPNGENVIRGIRK